MATAGDIVTGILVTELTADDDMMNNIMANEKRMMLKRFFISKQKRKKNMAYVTMNQLIRLSVKKKKQALIRKRKFAKKNDGESSLDHDYVDVVVSRFGTDEFLELKANFDIERSTFDKIVSIVAPKFGNHEKLSLPIERKVLMGLWTLSTQESFRNISDKFGIPKSSSYYAFVQLISALHGLASSYISWPSAESMDKLADEFQKHHSIPGAFGVVNSCQIPVKISPMDDNSEARAEPYSTVALQVVCDHKMRFIDIDIGNPQPPHAVTCTWKFFEASGLGQKLANGDISIPPHVFLLGDSTYPLKTYLMTPYKEDSAIPLAEEKEMFNVSHRLTRKIVNKAFNLLQKRFSRLKFVDTSRYDLVPQIVTAACVLHNIILEEEDVQGVEDPADDEKIKDDHVHPCPQADHAIDEDAIRKRDSVAEKMKPVADLKVEEPESSVAVAEAEPQSKEPESL